MYEKEVILVVDDNPANLDILIELLQDYTVLVSLNAKHGLQLLKENRVNLILLDIMMPNIDGFTMCETIKADIVLADIPILFLSANSDDDSLQRAFEVGGVDYVRKPFRPVELLARVSTHLKMNKMFNEIKSLAYYDYLSGARNRRSFFELGTTYVNESQYGELYAVMIDIDKFKAVNDTYGHATGDVVIKHLSDMIKQYVEEDMLFARLGGEEFGILIKSTSKNSVVDFTNEIRLAIQNSKVQAQEDVITYSISSGVAVYSEDMLNIDYLMDKADQALYDAKNEGRNRVNFRI